MYKVYTYFSFVKHRKFEIYMIEIEPGGEYESGSHGEKTEEYLTVVSGTLTMWIDGKEYEMGTRDAMRFDSDKKHIYIITAADAVHFRNGYTAASTQDGRFRWDRSSVLR